MCDIDHDAPASCW